MAMKTYPVKAKTLYEGTIMKVGNPHASLSGLICNWIFSGKQPFKNYISAQGRGEMLTLADKGGRGGQANADIG